MQHSRPLDEYSALNTLIHDRGTQWSHHARAIKFDIEFSAIEEERRRVAKELHDEILPQLARLIRSIQTQSAEGHGSEPAAQPIVDELHSTVAAFRDLLGELHAVDLEELGLVEALGNLCKRYSRFTQRSVIFIEESEDCNLSEHQQLCLYRAVQTVLRIFSDSDDDILLISCNRVSNRTIITVRCVDKRVSSADWLMESQEFNTVESWCAMVGAEVRSGRTELIEDRFPCDLFIAASEAESEREDVLTLIGQLTQVRIRELDTIIAMAQEEWADAIKRDCALFKKLAVELERKRISEDINKLILPRLERVNQLAAKSKDNLVRKEVKQRMQGIVKGVNGVISELHPRLLDQVGLVASIRTLVARFRHATLIETTMISNLWSDQFESIPLDTKFALYRVAQEALNNIEKHSDATRTLVIVTRTGDQLVVCIEDDGKGIQRTGTNTMSRGLKIIKERAAGMGATIAIQKSTSFDTGTMVTISLPCPAVMINNQHRFQGIAATRLG